MKMGKIILMPVTILNIFFFLFGSYWNDRELKRLPCFNGGFILDPHPQSYSDSVCAPCSQR